MRNRLYQTMEFYKRFVPHHFEDQVQHTPNDMIEDGVLKEGVFSILFSDIRGFTPFSEKLTSQQCMRFLNSYFRNIEPMVTEFGGFIDKYIGDGIMAVYENIEGTVSCDAPVHSAISMQDQIKVYNKWRAKCRYEPIKIGIGIHTGEVLLGMTGTSRRMESTAIGATVNLAQRLESLTKTFQSSIIISEWTYNRLSRPKDLLIRQLGRTPIEGFSQPVKIFEVFNSDIPEIRDEKMSTLIPMDQAIQFIEEKRYEEACDILIPLYRKSWQDPLPWILLKGSIPRSLQATRIQDLHAAKAI